jgi:DNA phosphorothioation-dependent restriction protein DptG
MPVRSTIHGSEDTLFITFTCFQWLPLIELTNGYDLVYKWFNHSKSQGHLVVGYVVMPNHVHALIYFSKTAKAINKIIGDGKRFMAYEIVKRLKEAGRSELLERLQNAVEPKDAQRGKKHEVWEDSFDSKICRTEKFMNQKLAYMHANPCAGKWKLAKTPIDYEHSSARFYISSRHAAYEVANIDEVLKIILNKFTETKANPQGNE